MLHDIMNEYVITYLNNILIFINKKFNQYKKYIKQIISKLASKNLKIKIKKCAFHKKKIFFLKHIVKINGI